MYFAKKSLVVAALAATAFTAEAEPLKRQITIPVSEIPTGLLPSGQTLPSYVVLPTNIIGDVESLILPVISLIPASIVQQVESVIQTLQPSQYPAFLTSVLVNCHHPCVPASRPATAPS